MDRRVLIVAGLFILLGIISGAFGAHALKEFLLEEGKTESFATACRYLFYGGFSLFVFVFSREKFIADIKWSSICMSLGTFLFSFSILGLIFIKSGLSSVLGPITPIGGLFMIIGWMIYLYKVIRQKQL